MQVTATNSEQRPSAVTIESVRIGAARRIPAATLTAYVEHLREQEAADADEYHGMVS